MGRLDGKVAFITGVARGQGRSHAVRLAEDGADIIGVDALQDMPGCPYPMATADDLDETVKMVEATGRRIVVRQGDVRDQGQLDAAVADGVATFGRVDIVCANAGIAGRAHASWEYPDDGWEEIIGVNLSGVWRTTKAAIPAMIAAGEGGSIVLTSSAVALRPIPNSVGYVTAKHGIIGLVRSMALELAPHRIRINSVHPTAVGTPMIFNDTMYRAFRPDLDQPNLDDATPVFESLNVLPIPWIECSDVSAAVAWLASDEARYITGIALPVDAGFALK